MKKTYKFLIFLSVFLFAGCNASRTKTATIQKEFKDLSIIEISTISGDCSVTRSSDGITRVTLSAAYSPANTFKPVISKENRTLILKEVMSGSNSGNSIWILSVPDSLKITFKSASGNISMENISGNFEIEVASGNITATDIKITGSSEFWTASGNVDVDLKESTNYSILLSSASGNSTLNYRNNPIIGKVEMQSRDIGEIRCPLKFTTEKIEYYDNQKYFKKSLICDQSTPEIKIYTASGKATLKK